MSDGDGELLAHEHRVTGQIYDLWTTGGDERSMAEHFFDGTYAALELYLLEAVRDLPPPLITAIPRERLQDLTQQVVYLSHAPLPPAASLFLLTSSLNAHPSCLPSFLPHLWVCVSLSLTALSR